MTEDTTDRGSLASLGAAFLPLARRLATDPELRDQVRKAADAATGMYKGVRSARGGDPVESTPTAAAADEPHAPPTHGAWKMITPGVVLAGTFAAGVAAAIAVAKRTRRG